MNKEWSRWVLYCWMGLGAFGLILELIGLRHDQDSLPPLTTILVTTVKERWWLAIPVLGFPVYLLIHFGRRIF